MTGSPGSPGRNSKLPECSQVEGLDHTDIFRESLTISVEYPQAMYNGKDISIDEWKEILNIPWVREAAGLNPEHVARWASNSLYGVKYDLASIEPGEVGDAYVICGDRLERPILIVRRNGEWLLDDSPS
jgi:hypothetical protein